MYEVKHEVVSRIIHSECKHTSNLTPTEMTPAQRVRGDISHSSYVCPPGAKGIAAKRWTPMPRGDEGCGTTEA